MNQQNIHDWSLLNKGCSDIIKGVLEQWRDLVASDEREPRYQRFLAEHAGLFFNSGGTNLVISQLEFGSERRPDFVVVSDFRSAGLHYEFIELKRPAHPPYSKGGSPSKHLNKALQQLRDWKRWLHEHRDSVQSVLPAKHAAGQSCSFTIIIGRRENSKAWIAERNDLSNENRVHVRSYDFLTDELVGKQFAHSCSSVLVNADELTLNQLANPFSRRFPIDHGEDYSGD